MQATKRTPQQSRSISQRRFLRMTYIILIVTIVLSSWQILRDPKTFPIQEIEIKGDLKHVDRTELQTQLKPFINSGFFNIDMRGIHQVLTRLPWIEKVSATRVWPHKIVIAIKEKAAIARWGQGGLLSASGEVFSPENKSVPANLPILAGGNNRQLTIISNYLQIQSALAPLNVQIARFEMSDRQAITITFTDGMQLYLGKDDIGPRLKRFVDVYPKVFANKANMVEYVDMRYAHGMAVAWKNNIDGDKQGDG